MYYLVVIHSDANDEYKALMVFFLGVHKCGCVFCLVEGCDPNQQVAKSKGKTAMHAAAAGGYVDIIACLRLVKPLNNRQKVIVKNLCLCISLHDL